MSKRKCKRIICNKIFGAPNNCFLVVLNEGLTLIDTGMEKSSCCFKSNGDFDLLIEKINENIEIEKKKLTKIILTHPHGDHCANVNRIKNYYGDIKLYGAKNSSKNFQNGKMPFGKKIKNLLFSKTIMCIANCFRGRCNDFDGFKLDEQIDNNQPIDEITFIHTPGHTNGDLTVRIGNEVIIGDLLVQIKKDEPEKLGLDDLAMNYKLYWESLVVLYNELKNDDIVCISHAYEECFVGKLVKEFIKSELDKKNKVKV